MYLHILSFWLKIHIVIVYFAWLQFFVLSKSHLFGFDKNSLSKLCFFRLWKFLSFLHSTCLSMGLINRFISIFLWIVLFVVNIIVLFLLIAFSCVFYFLFWTAFNYFVILIRRHIWLCWVDLIILVFFIFRSDLSFLQNLT